jgi:hypothetical protein
MKKYHQIQTALCIGLLAIAPAALAEEFSDKPQPQTLQQAIAFEKYKITSAEAQARKDAAEEQAASQTGARKPINSSKTAKSRTDRKTGQADAPKK